MSETQKIDAFLKQLSRALAGMPDEDRADIVEEIGVHLQHRAGEGRLDEALAALGSPQIYARNFLEELRLQDAYTDGGPAKTFGALLSLASRRTMAAAGLFASGLFCLIVFGFALTAVAEIIVPNLAGLWVVENSGGVFFGVIDPNDRALADEWLGRWLIPAATALSVVAFVAGQRLGRLFIRLMMKRRRRGVGPESAFDSG